MARAPRKTEARTDWYVELTNSILVKLAELKTDPKAWSKSWSGSFGAGIPQNGLTGRKYNGLNIWLLFFAGHSDPRFYTFDQAKQACGYKKNPEWKGKADTYKGVAKWLWKGEGEDPKSGVRKGEKGTRIYFYNFIKKYEDRAGKPVYKPTPAQIASGEVVCVASFPDIRIYTVFNAEQISGLPVLDIPIVDPAEKYLAAEALCEILGVKTTHIPGIDTACYRPGADGIILPAPGQFENIEHYWSTRFHEIIHWTGHPSRLDRSLTNRFGSDAYAFEELIAELGSAYLCAHLGIEGELRHPEYIAAWMTRMQDDKFAIFKAASLAQKAVDFILNGGVVEATADETTAEVDPEPVGAVSQAA